MVDLKPLEHSGATLNEAKFRELFEEKLRVLFPPALQVFRNLGEIHGFSIANLIYLGLQADCTEKVIADLLRWSEVAVKAPDPVTKYNDTREVFDIIYREQFMDAGHTVGGLGFQKTESRGGMSFYRLYRLVPPDRS